MDYIQGEARTQSTLFPALVDDYISEDNPVRFIDSYVDTLNFAALGFRHAVIPATGRPPYNPADLLKLYIYGYLNRTRSSRRLEKACTCNVELIWLLKRLTPDFKTISDFRKENADALRKVFREFTLLCKDLDLFGQEFIAIDGSKFAASNHASKTYTRTGLQTMLKQIDQHIDSYTKGLDNEDQREQSTIDLNGQQLQERVNNLKAHKARLEQLQQQMEQSGEGQISLTDPDSRKMLTGQKGNDVCYNVQMAVDDKHKLIVDFTVTSEANDQGQLYPMAQRAKEIFGVETLGVTADPGYYHEQDLKRCEDEQIVCYVPAPNKSQNNALGLYTDKDFTYDPDQHIYRCPAGEQLTDRGTYRKGTKPFHNYKTKACKGCALRHLCTRNKSGRVIYRWEHEPVIERLNERMTDHPEKAAMRKCLAEHPFGTIKESMDGRSFLVRTLVRVTAEMSLLMTCYNIKRLLNIFSVKGLLEALEQWKTKRYSLSSSFEFMPVAA